MTESFTSCREHWDIFEEPPEVLDDVPSEKNDGWGKAEKAAKLFSYAITFLIVLGGSVISSATLLFMTAQLSDEAKPYCNKDLAVNQELVVTLSEEEKVAWKWTLTFAYFIPQLATFLRSARILLFKNWNRPSLLEFASIFLSESLSTVGNAILVFSVLPKLDSVKGSIVMNCICLVSAVLSLFSSIKFGGGNTSCFTKNVYLNLLSVIIQIMGLILLTVFEDGPVIWCLPISAILISIGWWENYTVDWFTKISKLKTAIEASKTFPNSRYFTYSIVSLWKCIVLFGMMNFIEWCQYGNVDHLFTAFIPGFSDHDIIVKYVQITSDHHQNVIIQNQYLTPIWILTISATATYFAYIFGKFACKINIHQISYAIPLHLCGPVTTIGLLIMCTMYANDNCEYSNIIPPYLFFNLPPQYQLKDLLLLAVWLLLLLSYSIVIIHVWNPTKDILPSTEKIYVRPFYEPFLIGQDLGMNKRRLNETYFEQEDQQNSTINKDNTIPKLYVCGTMWHETKEEMLTFLNSVLILDEDQCSRCIARNYLNSNTHCYELETHIIFDDAFTTTSHNDQYPQINDFVKDLIGSVKEAVSIVHKMNITPKEPIKYHTPYGGRLEWTLPGKTKLIAHLKNNDKIRPKKRWSQVMYMYYILGHRIAERNDINNGQKKITAQNTYILAVDGDIHFRPPAIHMLLEYMKRDERMAATCGRVHPVGNGVFAWYQKFEYAISHWTYKAFENTSGCLLCCPGCFTIFRASAIMSILKKLTTKSTKAVHFIKFDHGEDRWISTLLVLCGYKVGYVASADAYTNCPEGFKELYNQRRRWIPSTTASVLDLLSRTHTVRKVNDNVSILYLLYQTFFNIMTILGPSLVLWMLVNICASTFHINQSLSFLLNAIPVLIYIAICAYVTKEEVQIHASLILCGLYTPIMCCFLIGGLYQIISNGFLSPWSLFFCFFFIQILILALTHPKEFYCLKYLIIYYTMLPTMHLLLYIYAVFNMHKVSWGTREANKLLTSDMTPRTSWLEDDSLKYGNRGDLSVTENMFWSELLDKYLYPINSTKEKTKNMGDLKELRDKVISTLFLLNVIFLSIIYVLTSKNVTITWPFGNIDYNGEEDVEIELFNTILIIVVSSLFSAQVIAMFIHRFGTFSQIMSNTRLIRKEEDTKNDPLAFIRKCQKNLKSDYKAKGAFGGWTPLNTSFRTELENNNCSDLEELFLSNIGKNGIPWDIKKDVPICGSDCGDNLQPRNGYINHGLNEDV